MSLLVLGRAMRRLGWARAARFFQARPQYFAKYSRAKRDFDNTQSETFGTCPVYSLNVPVLVER